MPTSGLTPQDLRQIITREENKRQRQMDALAITQAAILVFTAQLKVEEAAASK